MTDKKPQETPMSVPTEEGSTPNNIYIYGEMTTKSIAKAIKGLIVLEKEGKSDKIYLYINSIGGEISQAFALVDCIRGISIPVVGCALGEVCSAALLVLMACDKRYSLPNTLFMTHFWSGEISGNEVERKASLKEATIVDKMFIDHYKKYTKKTEAYIKKHLLTGQDVALTPVQARKHGLIDKVTRKIC